MHLAIIDTDPVASYVLEHAAQRRGHQVVCVGSAARLARNLPFEPGVVVMALDHASAEAVASIHTIRSVLPDAAIIVTGERHLRMSAPAALQAGASDFTPSPYNPHELVIKAERWASLLARAVDIDTAIRVGDLEVDLNNYSAIKSGRRITLTNLEVRLLYCLMEHCPNLAPLERLLTFGWDILASPDTSHIKTHMTHLRKKLADAGGDRFEIQSRPTIGYVLSHMPAEA